MFSPLITIIFAILSLCQCADISIWGPGLHPDTIVLPARYFFIQSDSLITKDDLKVDITGSGFCRSWIEILDRKDGIFIVRYRLYNVCNNFQISVLFKNQHIGKSPYFFEGPIYHEECDCPEEDYSTWASEYGCHKRIKQVQQDMTPFQNVNMVDVLDNMQKLFTNPGTSSYCNYVIKNNKLYRKCYGKHVGFNMFSDAILTSVMRKIVLPDQSFLINLGDWPLAEKKFNMLLPVFSWCGSNETYDIVLPTYDLTESTLENMGRVMLDMLSVQGNIKKKWNEKIPKAFWRGRDACRERLNLIDIARQEPDIYNASLTNFFFFRNEEQKYGPKAPHISFFDFFNYKYQINIDGTVAAYRFPYLLIGDSLVLKQESPYYEHFYHQIEPGVHYLNFKRDLSDLTEKIKWAMKNDAEAKLIAKNGREFARTHLLPQNIICYYANAFQEWPKHVKQNIEVSNDMEKIDKSDQSKPCECHRKNPNLKNDEL